MNGINFIINIVFLSSFLIAQGITNNQNILGQSDEMSDTMVKNHEMVMNMAEGNPVEKLISPITEWLGIFALGLSAGLLIFKTNPDNRIDKQASSTRTGARNLITAIAILSIR